MIRDTHDGGKLVTITKEAHDRLLRCEAMLAALEAAGVDNWEGYGEAYRSLNGDEEDEW